jgi:hypothetical protein
MTPSAGLVALGRDNTGAAAIVNSEQDQSFIDGMIQDIAAEKLRLKKKEEDDKKILNDVVGELDFDPTGIEALDNENEQLVVAAENYAVDQYRQGKNPMDVTTEEGKEFLRLQREAKRNAAIGKEADTQFRLAIKAANADGVNKEHAARWLQSYKEVKPKEGQTYAQATAQYIKDNPYKPKKLVGQYDFVTPILDNTAYGQDGRVKKINKAEVLSALNNALLFPQNQEIAMAQMETMNLDYNNPDDVKKFINEQYRLIESKFPTIRTPSPMSSGGQKDSENSSLAPRGKGSGGRSYTQSYTDHEDSYQNGKQNNVIALSGFASDKINLPDNKTETGTPEAIIRRKDGELFLEYTVVDNKGRAEKKYTPYDYYRPMIVSVFNGRDIAEGLINNAGSSPAQPSANSKEQSFTSSGGVTFSVEE